MKKAVEFAKSISEAEMEFISRADYGEDSELHKAALKKLIFDQNCITTEDQPWHPYEVVELVRWHCSEGHEREFAICNVIIALSIIAGTDTTNDPEYMLNKIADEYDKLPKNLREFVVNLLIKASKVK